MGPRPAQHNKTQQENKRREKVTIHMIPSSRENEKNQLFYIPGGPDVWLPKSQVIIGASIGGKTPHVMACEIPGWLAEEKEIEDHVE